MHSTMLLSASSSDLQPATDKMAGFPDAHVRVTENIYVYLWQLARDGE
jgi:hypothetical protein